MIELTMNNSSIIKGLPLINGQNNLITSLIL